MSYVPMDKGMPRKWLKCGYVEKSVLYDTDEGTPQGGIISPVLANLAVDGTQSMLKDHFSSTHSSSRRNKVNMIRHADDFVITGSSK